MKTPTMSKSAHVRDVLSASARPMTLAEVCTATGYTRDCVSGLLLKMVKARHVAREGSPGRNRVDGCYAYSIGPVKCRGYEPLSSSLRDEDQAADRAQRERDRQRRRNEARRAANAMSARPKKQPVVRTLAKRPRAASKSASLNCQPETVEQFLARGGQVECLPGIQKSNTHAPRRAFIASPMRIA